ncbi:uncharacterized protein LOC112454853 [Temnothorax curvispinosus]|uniref:Uncharacterized protein LOC112454853 n=1 Tax=Temnothorax curvispinosus TaxID=300111 RepID=A0A6J1PTN6_9HYME|nr:uncharacterized protein LOC112454853 [Temnothorax curvispinosus]
MIPQKTQITAFFDKKRGQPSPPEGLSLRIKGVEIPITPEQKYLGLWVDGVRSFSGHVDQVVRRAKLVANNLSRLLPNLGGAGGRVRRLYVAVVHAVMLYGAPIWWQKVGGSRTLRNKLLSVQRIIATRAARACRTVAHAGATTLAGIPLAHLLARSYAEVYEGACLVRERLGVVTPDIRKTLRQNARATLLPRWKDWAFQQEFGRRVIDAVHPVFEE